MDQYDEVNQAVNAAGAEVLIGGGESNTTDIDAWESDDSYDLTLDDVKESDQAFRLNEVDSIATLEVDDDGMDDPTFILAEDGSVDKVDVQDLNGNSNTLTFGASGSNTIGVLNFGSSVGDTNVDKLTIDGNGDDLTIEQVQQGDDNNVSLGNGFTIQNDAEEEAEVGTDEDSEAFKLNGNTLTLNANNGGITVGEVEVTDSADDKITTTGSGGEVTIESLAGDAGSEDATISAGADDTTIEDASEFDLSEQTLTLEDTGSLSIGEDTDSALGLGDGGELDAQDDGSHDGELEVYLERAGSGNSSEVLARDGDDTFHLGEYDNDGSFTVEYADEDHADGDTINDFETGEDTLEFDITGDGDGGSNTGAFNFAQDASEEVNFIAGDGANGKTLGTGTLSDDDLFNDGTGYESFAKFESALTDIDDTDLSDWGGTKGLALAVNTDGTKLWAASVSATDNTSGASIDDASSVMELDIAGVQGDDIAFV